MCPGPARCGRVYADGIAVATATVFDRPSVLGAATVTALANRSDATDPRRARLVASGSLVWLVKKNDPIARHAAAGAFNFNLAFVPIRVLS